MIGGPFILLFAVIGVIALIVWVWQWAGDSRRSRTALDILNERASPAAKSTRPSTKKSAS